MGLSPFFVVILGQVSLTPGGLHRPLKDSERPYFDRALGHMKRAAIETFVQAGFTCEEESPSSRRQQEEVVTATPAGLAPLKWETSISCARKGKQVQGLLSLALHLPAPKERSGIVRRRENVLIQQRRAGSIKALSIEVGALGEHAPSGTAGMLQAPGAARLFLSSLGGAKDLDVTALASVLDPGVLLAALDSVPPPPAAIRPRAKEGPAQPAEEREDVEREVQLFVRGSAGPECPTVEAGRVRALPADVQQYVLKSAPEFQPSAMQDYLAQNAAAEPASNQGHAAQQRTGCWSSRIGLSRDFTHAIVYREAGSTGELLLLKKVGDAWTIAYALPDWVS